MQSDGIKSDEATFLIVVGMVDEIPFSRYRERGTTVLHRTDTEVRFLSVNFSHSLKACITCETDVCNGIGVNRILRDGIVQFNGSCSPRYSYHRHPEATAILLDSGGNEKSPRLSELQ